jgi:hypothetical protein
MVKDYSVKMENGELVSARVGGLTYTRVEDILDPRDRETIEGLILKTRSLDSEGAMQAEFNDQVEQMKRSRPILSRIVPAVFLGAGAIVLLISLFSAVNVIRLLSREQSAAGVVVDQTTRSSRDSETGEVTYFIHPVVEYRVNGNQPFRVEMPDGSTSAQYAVGDQVAILYDPNQPRSARIQSTSGNLMMWLLPAVTFLVGIGFIAVILTMFRLWPKVSAGVPQQVRKKPKST